MQNKKTLNLIPQNKPAQYNHGGRNKEYRKKQAKNSNRSRNGTFTTTGT